jgi:hypothetical protein
MTYKRDDPTLVGVQVGYITEEDVGSLTKPKQTVIDQIIDQ